MVARSAGRRWRTARGRGLGVDVSLFSVMERRRASSCAASVRLDCWSCAARAAVVTSSSRRCGVGGCLGVGGDEGGDGGSLRRWSRRGSFLSAFRSSGDVEGLGALGAVAVDGDGLEAEAPGFGVGVGDVVGGAVVGEVDGLGDGAGEEGLGGGHHLDVALPGDGAGALGGLEGAVEDGEVLGLDAGGAFDGAGGVDVVDDGLDLGVLVAELEERAGDGVVDDLDHAAADELLVLDEGEVGLDAGGVAVHHEADGAGGREDGDLRVAVAVLLAEGEGFVPGELRGGLELVELRGDEAGSVCVSFGAGLQDLSMLLTSARCMRMTSRKGSRLT